MASQAQTNRQTCDRIEAIMAGAIDRGCTPGQAVDTYRNVW
jgi:hypothetical protein